MKKLLKDLKKIDKKIDKKRQKLAVIENPQSKYYELFSSKENQKSDCEKIILKLTHLDFLRILILKDLQVEIEKILLKNE